MSAGDWKGGQELWSQSGRARGDGNAHVAVFTQISGTLGEQLCVTSTCLDSLSSFWDKDLENMFVFLNSAFFSPWYLFSCFKHQRYCRFPQTYQPHRTLRMTLCCC